MDGTMASICLSVCLSAKSYGLNCNAIRLATILTAIAKCQLVLFGAFHSCY